MTDVDEPNGDNMKRQFMGDLRVLALNGIKLVMPNISLLFQRRTGNSISVKTEGSALLLDDITRGEAFDVALLMAPNMDTAANLTKVLPASRVNIARTGLGVVMREGRPKPDISTVEAFMRTMLAARSIAYTTSGASGIHFMAMCRRLGIADQVASKGKTAPTGMLADKVASGEAEFAVQQMSELVGLKGVNLVGPFPPELDLTSQIVAGISARSEKREAANAFVAFLSAPEILALLKAQSMTPG
jgi:molybdate transport system substrate-binding protein